VQVRLPVGEELHLEVVQRFAHRRHAPEQGRDDHRGAELGRDSVLLEIELGEDPGREEGADQLIHHRDGDIVGEDEAWEEEQQPFLPCDRAAEPEERPEGKGGRGRDAAHEHHAWEAPHLARERLARAPPVAGSRLEQGEPSSMR